MPIDVSVLEHVPLFHLMDQDELAELASHLDEARFQAGESVFREGDPGGTMHVVVSGRVETFILDEDGQPVVLAVVEPGEIFGELSLLDGEPRSASAVSVEPTRTFVVDRDDLERLFVRRPAAALDILTELSRRIRKTDVLLSQRVARNPNVVIEESLGMGDRVADAVVHFGGSWTFINFFGAVIIFWVALNAWTLIHPFDPPPFIGLNLVLSMLAALQAPVIMMSQNRQDAKDRVRSELDYHVNLKAEVEILQLHEKVDRLESVLERRSAG